jgi:outer membrane protein OmpA-like peptidoglycan-associated protein
MNYYKQYRIAAVAAVLLVAATGCGTHHVSRDISPEGRAGEVVFPSPDNIVLKEGTFPNVDNLRQIGPGVTKDQLYYLLGRPHFHEAHGAGEWDYLFHFRKGNDIVTCQYKVIFDEDKRGQTFHWAPESCAEMLSVAEAAPAAEPAVTRFDLSADALFAFARGGEQDILPGGREQIVAIAAKLKQAKASQVTVIGHTDRVGSEQANLALSQMRAQTVRDVLVREGVSASAVSAMGKGEFEPVKQCEDSLARSELVGCLQPNRRVEIMAIGMQ